ncbi:SpoVR family protein [Halalkalibacter lacteus]|uniref:SpoVR family protein n=1 Tax=Halalkalibacter lacteus TaxID=3090663 RepID=UPI002FC9185F
MNVQDYTELSQGIEELTVLAMERGLDFFTMHYEVCPADIIYTIGAYGMPTRFSHWSFGKVFSRMKMEYDFSLSKIYELVINSDPCYAFLLENNSLLQNKLIVAHVLGHSDFFKNNVYFSLTNRDMVQMMSLYANQIKEMEFAYGLDEVEHCLDAILAIQEHIDPWRVFHDGTRQGLKSKRNGTSPRNHHTVDGQELSGANVRSGKEHESQQAKEDTGEQYGYEEKDLLLFIAENSRKLKEWQKQLIYMLREEMYYFWPQIETKIMNEGWATYWHIRLMREIDLSEAELIEFSKANAKIIRPSQQGINPYFLGLKIFEALEQEYGEAFLFEARETYNDLSFLRNFLTKDLIAKSDMYLYGWRKQGYVITNKEWNEVKKKLLQQKVNGGFPYLVVLDGDYHGSGELLIKHKHEGMDLDRHYVEKTLPYVRSLWGKPVHLETVINGTAKRYTCQKSENIILN